MGSGHAAIYASQSVAVWKDSCVAWCSSEEPTPSHRPQRIRPLCDCAGSKTRPPHHHVGTRTKSTGIVQTAQMAKRPLSWLVPMAAAAALITALTLLYSPSFIDKIYKDATLRVTRFLRKQFGTKPWFLEPPSKHLTQSGCYRAFPVPLPEVPGIPWHARSLLGRSKILGLFH